MIHFFNNEDFPDYKITEKFQDSKALGLNPLGLQKFWIIKINDFKGSEDTFFKILECRLKTRPIEDLRLNEAFKDSKDAKNSKTEDCQSCDLKHLNALKTLTSKNFKISKILNALS